MKVFESVDHETLREEQVAEYGEYIRCITNDKAPLPETETPTTMSYYSVQDGLLFKSYCQDISGNEVLFVTN